MTIWRNPLVNINTLVKFLEALNGATCVIVRRILIDGIFGAWIVWIAFGDVNTASFIQNVTSITFVDNRTVGVETFLYSWSWLFHDKQLHPEVLSYSHKFKYFFVLVTYRLTSEFKYYIHQYWRRYLFHQIFWMWIHKYAGLNIIITWSAPVTRSWISSHSDSRNCETICV